MIFVVPGKVKVTSVPDSLVLLLGRLCLVVGDDGLESGLRSRKRGLKTAVSLLEERRKREEGEAQRCYGACIPH